MTAPMCYNCAFYSHPERSDGQCLLYPPQAFVLSDGKVAWQQPRVAGTNLCGQWAARIDVSPHADPSPAYIVSINSPTSSPTNSPAPAATSAPQMFDREDHQALYEHLHRWSWLKEAEFIDLLKLNEKPYNMIWDVVSYMNKRLNSATSGKESILCWETEGVRYLQLISPSRPPVKLY